MKIYLVRHAKAGSRRDWDGPDELRPLSKSGRRQAKGLARMLRDEPISRVVSSPYVRSIETVAPLAEERGLPVEESDALSEGTALSETLRLMEKIADTPTLLCTHGDVVTDLLSHLEDLQVPLEGDIELAKGSTWVLDGQDGAIARGRYLPPPA